MTYRTGRSLGRTIYRQVGDEPSKDDVFIGIMDTPELAEMVVGALNPRRLLLDPAEVRVVLGVSGVAAYEWTRP